MYKTILLFYTLFSIMILSGSCNCQPVRLFAGTFTPADEKGLFLFDLNLENGAFKLINEADAGPNPSYFCISKKHGLIYAANEVMNFKGIKGGGVTTLRYDAISGTCEKINEIAVPGGSPCYISLSSKEDYLLLANYTGGSVTVINLDDKGIPASVADNIFYEKEDDKSSHAHMISCGPSGKEIYVTDLGLDRIVIYNLDKESGKLIQIKDGIVSLAKGSGPRHFVFSSDGKKMYVICELNSTISTFSVDTNGGLKQIQTLTTLADGFIGQNACADIHIGKNGKYLYGSNRGENTIVTFRIGSDGKLTLAGHTSCGGDWPRNFVIDPSGKFILVGNQKSGNISLFRIDEKTGLPVEPAKNYEFKSPACLKFIN